MTPRCRSAHAGSVTDQATVSSARCVDDAVAAARSAAAGCGVHIRNLIELADLQCVYELYERIWRPDPANPPITTEFLRALAHSGNYVAGAYLGSDLVGACTGFFASPAGHRLHSHVAGVAPGLRGKNVGFALKTHQRAWALVRGISVITWTFDPLVCRNAYFNVTKLAASPRAYLPNFYGKMHDGINGDGDSDRLLVQWSLADAAVDRACRGQAARTDAAGLRAAGAGVALDADSRGLPVVADTESSTLLVRVPRDVEALRVSAGPGARRWRMAVREVLGGLIDGGGAVTGFDRSGWYVICRGQRTGPPR
jgi:predicted GNAT superfamily acetyltransferase